ncbi:hypothetical protein PAHAL_9G080400 [Panicum hallii]|uniref:Uncharacterized protein n=1 Tax=Panicum hallii TaxID=206008 RepID=A0A2T8I0L4_9POAL|nr:hypothetical protein PAHAL_9G080400 [Panicum hallii]
MIRKLGCDEQLSILLEIFFKKMIRLLYAKNLETHQCLLVNKTSSINIECK